MRTTTLAALSVSAALAATGAWAVGPSVGTGSGNVGVVDAPPPDYSASMKRLQAAEQKLRTAIQTMAQMSAGPKRDQAINDAQEALFDANRAMIALPPELRTGGGTASAADSDRAMERLQQAAQRFRAAVQAMATRPAGERRNRAAQEAREAIVETQEAMIALPGPHPEKQASAASGTSTQSASTTPKPAAAGTTSWPR